MKTTSATLLFLVLATVAHAAGPSPSATEVRAVRATSPIVIDGVISESSWQSAPVIDGLRQQRPNEGADPTQRTEVRVLYDDQALYVAARMFDAGIPCGPEANMAKYLASEAAIEAGNACIDCHGGYGFAEEYDIERKFRESRLYRAAPINNNLVMA